jgi:murein DD-endopeptidase MepM/ murein hydrolase activator NlpD
MPSNLDLALGRMAAIRTRVNAVRSRVPTPPPHPARQATNVRREGPAVAGPNPTFGAVLAQQLQQQSNLASLNGFVAGDAFGAQQLNSAGSFGAFGALGGNLTGADPLLAALAYGGMSGVGFGLGNGQPLGALGQMPLPGLGFGGLTGQSGFGFGIGGYRYNPFRDLEVTSEFGERPSGTAEGEVGFHGGTDYAVREGTPLPAIGGGVVTHVDSTGAGALGRNVEYRLDTGELVTYGHLTDAAPIPVVPGQRVGPGQIVGISGNTGASTGPHVHVEIRFNGDPVDPRQYLSLLP